MNSHDAGEGPIELATALEMMAVAKQHLDYLIGQAMAGTKSVVAEVERVKSIIYEG